MEPIPSTTASGRVRPWQPSGSRRRACTRARTRASLSVRAQAHDARRAACRHRRGAPCRSRPTPAVWPDLLLAAMRDERKLGGDGRILPACDSVLNMSAPSGASRLLPISRSSGYPRPARWADCTDWSGERWKIIRAVQQSQLRREVHRTPWGWRARSLRLGVAMSAPRLRTARPSGSRRSPPRRSSRRSKPSATRAHSPSWRALTLTLCRLSCTTSHGCPGSRHRASPRARCPRV